MFGSLKKKLKGWVKKITTSEATESPKEKTPSKKEIKKITVKAPKSKEDKKLEKEIKKAEKKAEKLRKQEEKEKSKEKKSDQTSQEEENENEAEQASKKARGDSKKVKTENSSEAEFEANLQEEELEKSLAEVVEAPPERQGFFSKFKKKLTEEKFEELFHELELILLQNNVAYEVVEKIRKDLEENLIGKSLSGINIENELKKSIESVLINPPNLIEEIKSTLEARKNTPEERPFVICFVGINGSGKTTTIAKIANFLQKNKLSVCLAAADTFRSAAIEQLQQHADKLKVHLIKKDYGSDPASIGFDAVAYAKKHKINVVLIDTAGRMQNKDSLMKEMEKIARVNKPDMKIFVGESITGNDATEQARAFNDTIDLTGIILSKADVDEKGGTAISVSHVTKKPILFLGTGQSYADLEVFDKDKLIKNLFG